MSRHDRWAFGALVVLAVTLAAFHVAYVALGVSISDRAQYISSYSLTFFLLWWIVADARRAKGRLPCHDFGFLVAATLPVSLLWYLIWSRGWKGVLMAATIVVLVNLPWLAAGLARRALYGNA